eukprot:jgi/Botrbrau1/14656/Bobra.0108s0017.1
MSGIINIFRNSLSGKDGGTGMPSSPSFSDFSMGVGSEVEEPGTDTPRGSLDIKSVAPTTPTSVKSPKSVWQSVFHPGSNPGARTIGKDYYDNADKFEHSVWDEVVKAERQKVFNSFDRDSDGFISASDLRAKLGNAADVAQLIAAADKNGDGRIDYYEFQELLRNS